MEIGDHVTVAKILRSVSDGAKNYFPADVPEFEAVFLGTGQRWDGGWENTYAEDGLDTFWANTKCHNCYIVQPIDKGGRYRKPLAVPMDDEENNLEFTAVSETHEADGDTINAPTQAEAEEIADEMMHAGQAYTMRNQVDEAAEK